MSEDNTLIKGELFHRENAQKYIYVLDQQLGVIYCFKRKVNSFRSKVIILSQCEILDYPSNLYIDSVILSDKTYPSFDFVSEGQSYAVLILEDQDLDTVKMNFKDCSQLPIPLSYRKCCRVFRGIGFVISIPFKASNALCSGLESVGDRFNETPDRIFKLPIQESKRFVPGNVASGILMGTGKMLIGIAKGIGGLVYEPIKGAKESGFKGATKGLGKGILGLVCKPVAGTLELVTLTVRGVNNTPSSMYKSALGLYKKNQARKEKAKRSMMLSELEDCAPKTHEINIENFTNFNRDEENFNGNEDEGGDIDEEPKIIDEEKIQLIENDEVILPILARNFKLREWIIELSEYLDREEELLFEELTEDDVIELRVQEAKQIGKKLKNNIMDLIEELHNSHQDIGFDQQTYFDFNSRMVANLKELGIKVKDEFVLSIASMIEEELLSEEDLGSVDSCRVLLKEEEQKVVEVVRESPSKLRESRTKKLPIINPFIENAKQWRPSEYKDNYRVPEAGPKGGLPLSDPKAQEQLRAVGKELIKSIGKKVLQGNFNLTTVSFPIRCMMANTSLHNTMKSVSLGPIFFTRAALVTHPIERLKFIVIGTLSTYQATSAFLKPVNSTQLNPIIGETLIAELEDGTKMYCEQTCNHPPISNFMVEGPEQLYVMSGYTQYSTSAGFNSLTVREI